MVPRTLRRVGGLMTVDELIDAIVQSQPSQVPDLLAVHVELVVREHAAIEFQLDAHLDSARQSSIIVAMRWLLTCRAMDGAFWRPEGDKPSLTPLGAWLLRGAATESVPPIPPPGRDDEDLQRIDHIAYGRLQRDGGPAAESLAL